MWKIAASTVFLIAWSLPAAAGDREQRTNHQIEYRDEARLVQLAEHLRETAHRLSERVQRRDHPGNRHQRYDRRARNGRFDRDTVRAVECLDEAARNFQSHVRRDRNRHETRAKLDAVYEAYRNAAARLQRVDARRDVYYDVDRVGSLVQEIRVASAVHSNHYAYRDRDHDQRTARSTLWTPWFVARWNY